MVRKIVYLKNCCTILNETIPNGIVPFFCFPSMHTSSLPRGPLSCLTSFPTLATSSSLVSLVSMGRARLVSKRQRRHDAVKTTLIYFFFWGFYWYGPFLKSWLNLLQYYLFHVFCSWAMWALNSLKEITVSCSALSDSLPPHGLGSPSGSSVHGILQARKLKWVAIPFCRGSSWPRDQTRISCIAGGFFITEPPGKPLHSLTRDQTFTPCLERWSLNHWTAREVSGLLWFLGCLCVPF